MRVLGFEGGMRGKVAEGRVCCLDGFLEESLELSVVGFGGVGFGFGFGVRELRPLRF